jgi:hypothetical protein
MAIEPEREPRLLSKIRRKLADSLIIIVLVPLLMIELVLPLVLIGINPSAWRSPSNRVS